MARNPLACIAKAAGANLIPYDRAQAWKAAYEERLKAKRAGGMDDAQARTEAARETLDDARRGAMAQRRAYRMTAERTGEILRVTEDFAKPHRAAELLAAYGRVGSDDVFARGRSLAGLVHALMADSLESFRRDMLGNLSGAQQARLQNMVRAVFGQDVNDPAGRQMADAWRRADKFMTEEFIAAGGDLKPRKNWLPQRWDPALVREAGMAQFVADAERWFDLVDFKTGRPLDPPVKRVVLQEAYERITTGGLTRGEWTWPYEIPDPNKAGGAAPFWRSRAEERVFNFRNADDYLEFADRYMQGDVWSAINGHIRGMTSDIAIMQVLGPNPHGMVRWISDQIKAKAGQEPEAGRRAWLQGQAAHFEHTWAHVSGEAGSPRIEAFAATGSAVRGFLTSAKLGSAAVTALFTDPTVQFMARSTTGLKVGRMVSQMVAGLSRKEAREAGLMLDAALHDMANESRILMDTSGPEITRRLPEFVLRASGLELITRRGKDAFGLEMMQRAADNRRLAFDKLPPVFRAQFEQNGWTAADWDALRAVEPYRWRGDTRGIRISDVAAADRELGVRWGSLIQRETARAVPDANPRTKAILTGETRPGTAAGELLRSVAQWKSFPVTLLWQTLAQLGTIASLEPGVRAGVGVRWGAGLVGFLTLGGAVSLQVKQIQQGRDPLPMNTPDFWARALLTGGGLGIFGDLVAASTSSTGHGLAATVAGPTVQFIGDSIALTAGNAFEAGAQAIQGEPIDVKFPQELRRYLSNYTPGSSLWYWRKAYDAWVLRSFERMMDPEAEERFAEEDERRRSRYDQDVWWPTGAALPERAPNLEAAAGAP